MMARPEELEVDGAVPADEVFAAEAPVVLRAELLAVEARAFLLDDVIVDGFGHVSSSILLRAL